MDKGCPRCPCSADIFCEEREESNMKDLNGKRPSGLALIPFAVFIVIYMGAGIYYQVKGKDMAFYQFPSVTAMFLAVLTAFIMFKGSINEKFETFAKGAANVDILTMLMIYILAGAFASVAAAMGGRESTVNLGLSLVPVEFLAADIRKAVEQGYSLNEIRDTLAKAGISAPLSRMKALLGQGEGGSGANGRGYAGNSGQA